MKIKNYLISALLSIGVGLFIYSLYQRIPHIDDAWIGEQVYWLNHDGGVKNVLMKNYSDNQNGLLAYHKAFVYSGLWAVLLFGFGLSVLKSVSLFYLLLFMGIFYYYLVVLKNLIRPRQFVVVALLLVIEPHIFEFAFVYRPEIMLMTTGFISYIFLEQRNVFNGNKTWMVLLSALFSGLSILVHLNGLMFVLAGGAMLLFHKQFRYLLLYSMVNLVFVYFYFSHLSSLAEVALWFHQLTAYNSGKSEVGFQLITFWHIFLKFFGEHMRYFHSPKEMALTLLVVTTLVVGYKKIKSSLPGLLPFTLILLVSLAFIAPSKTAKYLIPVMPYLMLMGIITGKKVWKYTEQGGIRVPKNTQSVLVWSVLSLFVLVSLTYDGLLAAKKFSPLHYQELSREFVTMPTDETTILAPMVFIFDEIDDYKEIVGLMSFNERAKTNADISSPEFFVIADDEGFDYILLSDHYVDKFHFGDLILESNTGSFRKLGRKGDLTIFENISNDEVYLR